jgi:hypothetical protein
VLAIEYLVSRGHDFGFLWREYSPAQVMAFYAAARRNRNLELAENLVIGSLGANGGSKDVNQKLDELNR